MGVIDSGVDLTHPDVAPNLDVARSCSFIYSNTPTADPQEVANGDCSNKAAVQDIAGHGTHVASEIAAPINGIGIAGVAPEATIVAIKACTQAGFCFADSVAAALRYAGDLRLDVVNLSLFADPYLYYCKSDAQQRAILREMESAARYAQQQGVTIVASAGNEQADLHHPIIDDVSPDWPPDSAVVREVKNNCRVSPAELPQTLTVSATGPIGYPGYDLWIADYSSVGVDVAAPGGDYFRATGTVVGTIGMRPHGPPGRVDLGYYLGRPWWGRGLMREAIAAVVLHAFGLGARKVEAEVFLTNPRGMRLVESLGFRREGTVRRAVLKRGIWLDEAAYGLLPGELVPGTRE